MAFIGSLLVADGAWKAEGVAFWDSGVADQEALPGASQVDSNGQVVNSEARSPTARTINKTYSDHPWDIVTMAGLKLPGICEVANGLTEIGIDMKHPDGADGSTITVKGYKPGKFDISCTVWTAAQWTALQGVIATVWRKPKKKTKLQDAAFDIHHPALQLLGVTSCVVESISYPKPGSFEGSKVITFKCLQNVRAGKKSAKKTVGDGTTVVNPLKAGAEGEPFSSSGANFQPANATPPKPSTLRSEIGPSGPVATPAGGTAG
jgi:hypothetical protein